MTDGTNPWSPKSLEWTHTESPPWPGNLSKPVRVDESWTPYNYN
jgi:hypothetical protein